VGEFVLPAYIQECFYSITGIHARVFML